MRAFYGIYKIPYSESKIQHEAAIIIQSAKFGLRPEIRKELPSSLSALIQWCWSETPDKRPSFDTILAQLEKVNQEFLQHEDKWNALIKKARRGSLM
jgi:hypothetical protein